MLSSIKLALFFSFLSIPSVLAKEWNSPQELMLDLKVYQAFVFCTLGIHVWEHLAYGLPWELKVYTGKVPFRWGMIPYLIIRYSLYLHLIATMININATSEVNCEAWLIVLLLTLSLATCLTTLIFLVRTVAIWRKNFYVSLFLTILWLAEVAMHFTSPLRIKSFWYPLAGGCATTFTRSTHEYNIAYLFVLITDLLAFVLAAWKLRNMTGSGVGKLLFRQGMGYFLVAFLLNGLCLSMLYADINPIMSYMVSPFTVVMSGIVACRAFQDLQQGVSKNSRQGSSGGQVWVNRTDGVEIKTEGNVGGGFDSNEPIPLNRHQRSESHQNHQVTTTFGGFGSEIDEEEVGNSNEIPMPITTSQVRKLRSNSNAMKSIQSEDSIPKSYEGEKDLEEMNLDQINDLSYGKVYGNDETFDTTDSNNGNHGIQHCPFDDSFGSASTSSSPVKSSSNQNTSSPTSSPRRVNNVGQLRFDSDNQVPGYAFTREVRIDTDEADSMRTKG